VFVEQAAAGRTASTPESADDARAALRELEELSRESQPVLDRLEHALHPWTSFVIIPLFALANAGIEINREVLSDAGTSPVAWGVALGLIIGKPVGIAVFAFAAIRLGIARLPSGVHWAQIVGVGMIGGIGFTVSLFITSLAFNDAGLISEAKLGILFGSALIGACGYTLVRLTVREAPA
jgi:NhaA family Na+:H+ antiporter